MHRIRGRIRGLDVPREIFEGTINRLGGGGSATREAAAYWSGTLEGGRGAVRSVLFAEDYPGHASTACSVSLPAEASYMISEDVSRRGERLLAWLHTHPGEAYHSQVDDRGSISYVPGFVSIVIPEFGRGVTSLSQCAVHEYVGGGRWDKLGGGGAAGGAGAA